MEFPEERDIELHIRELERAIERYVKENEELRNENESLKKKLLLYENPHTPPSRQMFPPKIMNPPGKRGAPKGHKGATRILDNPDKIIHVTAETCPKCHHALKSPLRTEKRMIFDIPPPQKVMVTEFQVDVYKCSTCNTEIKAKHPDMPQKGGMGVYLLKYNLPSVIRRVQEFLKVYNNLDLSIKGIYDALIRVGEACRSEYERGYRAGSGNLNGCILTKQASMLMEINTGSGPSGPRRMISSLS